MLRNGPIHRPTRVGAVAIDAPQAAGKPAQHRGHRHGVLIAWLPEYLVRERPLSFIRCGFIAAIPFVAAGGSMLILAALSDELFRRGKLRWARTVVPGLSVTLAGVTSDHSLGLRRPANRSYVYTPCFLPLPQF